MLILSTNIDQKPLGTEPLIAICGDKWQSKTLFLAIFYPSSSIVKSVFDCHLSSVILVVQPKDKRLSIVVQPRQEIVNSSSTQGQEIVNSGSTQGQEIVNSSST